MTFDTHLIKCLRYKNSIYSNHWINELNGYLNILKNIRLKPNNKIFTYEEFYKMLCDYYLENVYDLYVILSELDVHYSELIVDEPDNENLLKQSHNIIHDISLDLSNKTAKNMVDYLK
jgi:hypothetical protein